MGSRRTERGRLFSADADSEVHDELEFHLEQRVREYMAAGLDEASARRSALERIGDLGRVQAECADLLKSERRALARRTWLGDLVQDFRFAVRAAVRAPLFALMAVLTLALGVGANSAVFGVVKSVLLDALPYADAHRLVRVQAYFEASQHRAGALSAGTAQDLVDEQRSYTDVALSSNSGPDAVLQSGDGATTVRLAWVSPGFFRTLGVAPQLGRAFDDVEATADTAQVIILSHGVWQQHFGGERDILGRRIQLNGLPRTVVGVLPPSFVHPVRHSDVYMPLNLGPTLRNPVAARGSHFLEAVARLNTAATHASAQAELDALASALSAEHPRENAGLGLRLEPLHDTMAGEARTPLLVLLASSGLVLLVACANLAAALLSRTITRRKEFAVRISLGAGRGRLVRQLLAESVLLAAVGGVIGLLLASGALAALRGVSIDVLPAYANLSLDAGAVAVTFALALLTGVAFGLAPALAVGRAEPQSVLREETRGAGESRGAGTLRGLLVAGQLALCLSLLAGAGLLTRSLFLMASEPLGFRTASTLAFEVPLPSGRYPTFDARVLFYDEMLERIAAQPGVTDVAITNFLPTRVYNSNGVTVVGSDQPTDTPPFIHTTGASETYFETLGIPIVAGRAFTRADDAATPPVALVSETMARRFWPNGGAVGARIRVGPDPESTPIEVIGVARDTRTSLVEPEPLPMLYMPLRQGWWGTTFLVRTSGDPLRLVQPLRRELLAVDPGLPMANVTTLDAVMRDGLAARRLPMLLMLAFGMLALLLACIGIYAMFANMAAAREREFGVRMALGSSRGAIAALVLRQGALWMGLGVAGGVVGVVAVSRAVRSLVYGIAPLDPLSIAAAVGALLLCAGIALAAPVRRATRADPAESMR